MYKRVNASLPTYLVDVADVNLVFIYLFIIFKSLLRKIYCVQSILEGDHILIYIYKKLTSIFDVTTQA